MLWYNSCTDFTSEFSVLINSIYTMCNCKLTELTISGPPYDTIIFSFLCHLLCLVAVLAPLGLYINAKQKHWCTNAYILNWYSYWSLYCQISPSWLWQADSVRNVKWLGERNHKQFTFIRFFHDSLHSFQEASLHIIHHFFEEVRAFFSCQTSREGDHGEDQHAEQNHPGHLTCYWSLPSSRGLYRERVMLFTNKSPLKTYSH